MCCAQGQQPGTTTAELRATLAELARQAEETQLLRTELARAKQSSRPDDATTTHSATFQPKVCGRSAYCQALGMHELVSASIINSICSSLQRSVCHVKAPALSHVHVLR